SAVSPDDHEDAVLDTEGRILRDNVYGSIEDDVWRRDFTCNALYYNIADFSIWDYAGGVADIQNRRLVLIGDPATRLREDPVRMLRAVRFAAKLDFTIDPDVSAAMHRQAGLVTSVPPARLFDEFTKLFQGGHAERTFELLWEYRLFDQLFPEASAALAEDEQFGRFVRAALVNTDRRVRGGKPVTPMFLLGVLFWGPVRKAAQARRDGEKMSESQAIALSAYELTGLHQSRISIPKRFSAPMRDMLALQPRFEQRRGKRAMKLLDNRRFRAAYDFLMLRVETGEADADLGTFWTDVQSLSDEARAERFKVQEQPRNNHGRKKRRTRRRRRSAPAEHDA
ncbi:MAG: polynucleotide adenylyltransferase PcnB, partial [Pseudomonadota bacterium]